MEMTKIKCFRDARYCMHPKYTEGNLRALGAPNLTEFRVYDCDCGSEHKLDVRGNIWLH